MGDELRNKRNTLSQAGVVVVNANALIDDGETNTVANNYKPPISWTYSGATNQSLDENKEKEPEEIYYVVVTAIYPFLRNILPNHNLTYLYASECCSF